MNREEFEDALAAYGADFARWPTALADRARALVARDPQAGRDLAEARRLDALLANTVQPATIDSALVGRIIAGVSGGRTHETAVRPTGKLFAWAGASMAVFLVAGFVLGMAIPTISDDEDDLAALMFGGGLVIQGDVL
jgi:hypothetical protein